MRCRRMNCWPRLARSTPTSSRRSAAPMTSALELPFGIGRLPVGLDVSALNLPHSYTMTPERRFVRSRYGMLLAPRYSYADAPPLNHMRAAAGSEGEVLSGATDGCQNHGVSRSRVGCATTSRMDLPVACAGGIVMTRPHGG